MKNLLYFKYADLAAQLLALLIPWGYAAFTYDINYFFFGYFTVFIAQIISCMLNSAYLPKVLQLKDRKRYIKTIVGIFVFTLVTAIVLIYIIGMLLVVAFPIIAIWYMVTTFREIKLIRMVMSEGIEFKKSDQLPAQESGQSNDRAKLG
ncbi:hypothetical protein CJD36_007090 [Flavipsychrobacter stenotrophus]|uniref:Uncharacterized protein n=1 Tax=Flavipsychrobacter stenotrophus TaxID=2077091 RepID=A0A2S7SXX3_9BACT|nr:hypothetical protein [Flavipsychrobacter stenotrophus]PQJ11558.1 hypothetical protein CJD36_007090 [Flavipsychrobacter stenotrophus]